VEFVSVDVLVPEILRLVANEVLWAKPSLWCQKAYDFLCFWKENDKLRMVAVNASHAKKHSVLLWVVHGLAFALGEKECVVESIRFDFLVPPTAEFQVGAVSGRLTGWKNLVDVDWPNSATTSDYVSSACIVVVEVEETK
jgi:hypothetical protein